MLDALKKSNSTSDTLFLIEYLKHYEEIEEYIFKSTLNVNKNIVDLILVVYNIDVLISYDLDHFHIRMAFNSSPRSKAEEFREFHILYAMHLNNIRINDRKCIKVTNNALRRMRTEYK